MCVGCHLSASLTSRPAFRCLHQPPANPLPPHVGVHIPAFDISYGPGTAAIDMWPDGRFHESTEPASKSLSHEHLPRKKRLRPAESIGGEKRSGLIDVLIFIVLWPEAAAHSHPFG